ncbi:hypothetical protein [Agrilutibacter solisilvae]|uniref:Uncharacterized protein n=1 Tax=Agrilutibacter solisilvae TaxID=2763317 RepID=A0A974XYR2_9GAMM|nr:hypothetical protein [Lysobacter solisilvae]QSX77405.1 hypothetical protein I8J32_011615 [Lysobacter solisilvae]
MITSSDFRDSWVTALFVGYDWERSEHFAELALRTAFGADRLFRVERLTSWGIHQNFDTQWITKCTLVERSDGLYLCLDPAVEGKPSNLDNFWFLGARVVRVEQAAGT